MTPPSEPTARLADLRGALSLTGAGLDFAAALVQELHTALTAVPRAAPVYGWIRRINRALFGAADRALALAGPTSPAPTSPFPLVSVLHGVFGDRLRGNPLRTVMHLRHRGRRLKLGRRDLARALPDAGERIVVFVHGLAADESSWRRGSARAWGRQDLDYGDLLAARGGVTPLYLRYNSGLQVATNGRALADLLRRLSTALPGPPRRLVLVGHSMGGLVARSACHHGQSRGDAWAGHVTDVVCLGAPHRGAVLEKIGAATVATLAGFGVTAPLARAFDLRSAGIKDLHRGAAHHDEALLPRARYHDLAGTLASPDHLFSWALGDGLVRVASAAPDRPNTRRTILPGVGHLAMLAHPDVLAHLAEILGDSSTLH